MPPRKKSNDDLPYERPALTYEAEENRMIAYATRLAEEQLRNGTASSQVITHYLKLGTERERLEKERLRHENELLKAKTEAISSAKSMNEMYALVVAAFKEYKGEDEGVDI